MAREKHLLINVLINLGLKNIEKLQFIQKKISNLELKINQKLPPYYIAFDKRSEWINKKAEWEKQLRFWEERFKKTAKELYELY